MRVDVGFVEAHPEDVEVAKCYPLWAEKGKLVGGKSLSIGSAKCTYKVGEAIRIIHVVEVCEAGHKVYIMGPKIPYGEFVDGKLATEFPPQWATDPLIPGDYDGVTLNSPAVDYNYNITAYSFETPHTHEIYWKMGSRISNTLKLTVVT